MSTTDTPSSAVSRRPHLGIAALIVLGIGLGALAYVRRDPALFDRYYELGNVIDTHKGTGFSLLEFGRGLGHLELAAVALLLAIAGKHLFTNRLTGVVASLAVFALVFADSATRYATRVGSHLYLKPCDDALISMRYARNLAEGRGLVFNAGEYVDGFTNPLWTWIMVLPHALGLHEGVTTVPIVALGGALLVAMALLSRVVLEDAGVPATVQIVVVLIMVFDQSLFEFTIFGLETPLLAMGVALVMAGATRKRERWIAAGLATITLARADGAVVAGLMTGWMVLEDAAESSDRFVVVVRRHWRRFAVVGAVALTLVAWRLAVYGHPAPNTAYLKVYSLSARLKTGIASYGVRGVVMYGIPVVFVVWASQLDERARRARRLLAPFICLWAYSIYVGGDAFNFMRFLAPATPALWTAVGIAASSAWTRGSSQLQAAAAGVFLLVAPVQSERGVLGSSWDRHDEIKTWVLAAKTLERNVPEGEQIATFYAGLPYYAPKHKFIDMLGKAEAHIAHGATIHGAVPGHNKFDFAYVYSERKPGVTFTALSCDDVDRSRLETLREISQGLGAHQYQAPVEQLRDPTFRELYLPNRVVLREGDGPAGHPLGCWFIRKDSTVPQTWQTALE